MSAEAVEVTVEVPAPDAPEVPEPDTTVIVVEDSSEIPPVELDHESRITALEIAVAAIREQAASAQITAEFAEEIAEDAIDLALTAEVEAETAVEETVEIADELDDIEDDVLPDSQKKHWLFRSRDEWRK